MDSKMEFKLTRLRLSGIIRTKQLLVIETLNIMGDTNMFSYYSN